MENEGKTSDESENGVGRERVEMHRWLHESWRANVDSSARINGRNIDLRRETMENGLFTNSIDVIDQKHFIGPKKEAEAASCGWK